MQRSMALFTVLLICTGPAAWGAPAPGTAYEKQPTWPASMLSARAAVAAARPDRRPDLAATVAEQLQREFPVQWDWLLADGGVPAVRWLLTGDPAIERGLLAKALEDLGPAGRPFADEARQLESDRSLKPGRLLALYARAAEARRARRLATVVRQSPRIVFTRHFNIGGSHYAYTEAQSDAQAERNFRPGSQLCLLDLSGPAPRETVLIDDPRGVIRDPDVSYDGKKILFAWKKSDREDDYHLYEMDAATRSVRQLTSGLGYADYEAAYLPGGDIVFNSTRCVQIVDCWWTEVSNLYTCDKDGNYVRRLSFDQVHTNFPAVLPDGRVVYTRWEYNDRGQIYVQGLFQMNPDGTSQTEFYGNNSWFPTTILHARGVPGSHKVVAVASGHHSYQAGKLIVIDVARGRQENSGVTLVAPVRPTPAEKIDAYGQQGDLFQYPYPLNESEVLVTYCPLGWRVARDAYLEALGAVPEVQGKKDPKAYRQDRHKARFGVYWMDLDGRRELLAADANLSCNQSVPLGPRAKPTQRPSTVDFRKEHGTYYVQDVYAGPGLAGVERGIVKRLRVVTMDFRVAGIGANGNGGPAGGALVSTPPAINNGTWDVKAILGDATVHDDGSAFFKVPARTPVYFQMLDDNGRAVQTMRSWSTLQPGENASCVGCHEEKTATPQVSGRYTKAFARGPDDLQPFHGPPRGFSFAKEVQPILDRHCVACHDDRTKEWTPKHVDIAKPVSAEAVRPRTPDPSAKPPATGDASRPIKAFSLLGETTVDTKAKRRWSDSYLALTARGRSNEWVNWVGAQSVPPMLPPYFAGSARSRLVAVLSGETGQPHYGAKLSRAEQEKIAAWIDLMIPYCGDYAEAHAWTPAEVAKYDKYMAKRKAMEEMDRKSVEALKR